MGEKSAKDAALALAAGRGRHPCLYLSSSSKTWMAEPSPAMTGAAVDQGPCR
jgi:hypothetical protein